jgi:glycosyltransferase involved in cell wall biosynthesis
MRKKICYVLPKYDAADHTHFAHVHDFLKEIAKQADIFLIIEKTSHQADFRKLKEELGVKKIYFQGGGGFCGRARNMLGLFKAGRQGYKNFYVHYSFFSAFNASVIVKIFGGKVFYWNCGLPWKYKRFWPRDIFERLVYKMIDYLVTGTESLAREYGKRYGINPARIKIMPNWISSERFSPELEKIGAIKKELGILPGEKILLFVHRLSKRKGAHLLPEIFQKIKYQSKKLLVVGDGPERKRMEENIKNIGLQEKIKLLGWMPNKDLANYYCLADVLLMPSEEEGFPRVIMEAMACGLPFAAFDVGGIKEIIPKEFYENILPLGSTGDFSAEADRILSSSKEYYENWSKTAAEWLQQFETKAVAEKFLAMF